MASRIPIAFDVLGTCFSLDPAKEALVSVFKTVSDAQAESVIQDWFHSAQRDFTCASRQPSRCCQPEELTSFASFVLDLSMNGSYMCVLHSSNPVDV